MSTLYQGATAPETYKLRVLAGASGLDLTTVTSAVLIVSKPSGTIETWATAISGAVPAELLLTHTFLPTSEVDVPGDYRIYARLTVPGGFFGTERVSEPVHAQFEV